MKKIVDMTKEELIKEVEDLNEVSLEAMTTYRDTAIQLVDILKELTFLKYENQELKSEIVELKSKL